MGGTARVLIVDDERANRKGLTQLVERAGHSPLTAVGGAEALAVLACDPVDLVLLDLMMPGVDGMAVLAELRKQGRLPALPVVVVTGHDREELRVAALTAGASDFLTKPVNETELVCRMRTLLELKQLREIAQAGEKSAASRAVESRELLQALLDGAPDFVIQVDPSGIIRYVNRTLPHLTRDEVVGSSWFSYSSPEDAVRLRAILATVLETGQPASCESALIGPDGTAIWISRHIGPLRSGGKIIGAVVIARDTTAGRTDALAVAESERVQRATLDALGASVAVLDARGRITATNARWRTFATENACDWRTVSEGVNYLAVCDRAAAAGDENVAVVARAIREVIGGKRENWLHEYPCHAPSRERWFYCRVTRFPGESPGNVVVLHEDITDLRHAQRQLAESDELFRSLATVAPVGIFRTNPAGQLAYVNPRWCTMMGLAEEAAPGGDCWSFVHPDDAVHVSKAWHEYLKDGRAFRSECRVVGAHGQATWVQAQAATLRDAGGTIVGHVGTLVDITAQKTMEESLRTISASSVGPGLEDYFHVVARQLAKLVGAEIGFVGKVCGPHRDRIQALAFWADGTFVPHLAYDLAGTPCHDTIARRAPVLHESGLQELFPEDPKLSGMGVTSYAAVPLFDARGRVQGLLGIFGRKPLAGGGTVLATLKLHGVRASSEMERQRSEERFANLFEFAADAVLMTDRDGTIRLVNRQAEEMFGWSRDELLGRSVEILVPETARERHPQLVRTFMQDATPRTMGRGNAGLFAVRKDGTQIPVDISLSPVESDEGPMVAAAVRDLTVHVQASAELRTLEDQLRQSQRMDAVGRLAGGVAHDFNNILTVIQGYTELASETPDVPPDVQDALAIIARCGRRAADLTRQLLAFSRKQVLRPCAIDVNASIREIEVMCRRLLPENIVLSVHLDPGTGKVLADPGQLNQVLMNLAVNARDAMPTGGTLAIRTDRPHQRSSRGSPGADAGDFVRIRMTDSGSGMDAETRARIFEPFFTTKPQDRGTGLGLSTVFGIIAQSSGTIEVESEVGAGTTFTILLPWIEAEPAVTLEPAPVSRPDTSRRTVLLVEDEPEVRELTRRLLVAQGHQVLEADGPEAALRLAREHGPEIDVVLTDVILPRKNGVDLACDLLEVCPRTRVLFMSGYTDDMLVQHGALEPGVDILEKPFTPESLGSALRDTLNKPAAHLARRRTSR